MPISLSSMSQMRNPHRAQDCCGPYSYSDVADELLCLQRNGCANHYAQHGEVRGQVTSPLWVPQAFGVSSDAARSPPTPHHQPPPRDSRSNSVPPVLHPQAPRRSPTRPHHLLKITASRISHQWFPPSQALPNKRLAYINARILSYPHRHHQQNALPVQRDHPWV